MSDDGELEYFPDDGYDYSQHLVKSDELTSGAGFFVQAVGLADKLKDRVFTGEIEKHESEMDPEEAALVRDLVFSADEAEMASDDEFFEGFRCDRTEGMRIAKSLLWRPTEDEEEQSLRPPAKFQELRASYLAQINGQERSGVESDVRSDDVSSKQIDEDEEFGAVLKGYDSDLDDFSETEEGDVADEIAAINDYALFVNQKRCDTKEEDLWKLSAESKQAVLAQIERQLAEEDGNLEEESKGDEGSEVDEPEMFLDFTKDSAPVEVIHKPTNITIDMFRF